MPNKHLHLASLDEAQDSSEIAVQQIATLVKDFETKHAQSRFPFDAHTGFVGNKTIRYTSHPSQREILHHGQKTDVQTVVLDIALNTSGRRPIMFIRAEQGPHFGFHILDISFSSNATYRVAGGEPGQYHTPPPQMLYGAHDGTRELHPEYHSTIDAAMVRDALKTLHMYLTPSPTQLKSTLLPFIDTARIPKPADDNAENG